MRTIVSSTEGVSYEPLPGESFGTSEPIGTSDYYVPAIEEGMQTFEVVCEYAARWLWAVAHVAWALVAASLALSAFILIVVGTSRTVIHLAGM